MLSQRANLEIRAARKLYREKFNYIFPRLSKDKHLKVVRLDDHRIIVVNTERAAGQDLVEDVVNEGLYDPDEFPSLKRNGRLTREGWILPLSEYPLVVEFLREFDFYNHANLCDDASSEASSGTDEEDMEEDMWAQFYVAATNSEVRRKIYGPDPQALAAVKNGLRNMAIELSADYEEPQPIVLSDDEDEEFYDFDDDDSSDENLEVEEEEEEEEENFSEDIPPPTTKKTVPKKAAAKKQAKKNAPVPKKKPAAKKPAAKKTTTKKPAAKKTAAKKTAVAAKKKQDATKKAKKETKPKKAAAAKKKVKK